MGFGAELQQAADEISRELGATVTIYRGEVAHQVNASPFLNHALTMAPQGTYLGGVAEIIVSALGAPITPRPTDQVEYRGARWSVTGVQQYDAGGEVSGNVTVAWKLSLTQVGAEDG